MNLLLKLFCIIIFVTATPFIILAAFIMAIIGDSYLFICKKFKNILAY